MTVKNGMTFGEIVGNRGFFPDHLCRRDLQEHRRGTEKYLLVA